MPVINGIDTDLLRQQRDWLLGASLVSRIGVPPAPHPEVIDGLVNLCDSLLDDAEGFSQPTPAPTQAEPRRSLSEPEKPAEGPLDERSRSLEDSLPGLADAYSGVSLPAITEQFTRGLRLLDADSGRWTLSSAGWMEVEKVAPAVLRGEADIAADLSVDDPLARGHYGRPGGYPPSLRSEIVLLRDALRRLASSVAIHDAHTADEVGRAQRVLSGSMERVA